MIFREVTGFPSITFGYEKSFSKLRLFPNQEIETVLNYTYFIIVSDS